MSLENIGSGDYFLEFILNYGDLEYSAALKILAPPLIPTFVYGVVAIYAVGFLVIRRLGGEE
jgi:hypothetical protein